MLRANSLECKLQRCSGATFSLWVSRLYGGDLWSDLSS